MMIRSTFNRVIAGTLLSVICGTTVAANHAGEVEITKTEQPEKVKLEVTDIDKLQLELAREIGVGEQASALKVLADSFADLPFEAVKALLERGGEPGRLQRAVEALQTGRQSGRSVAPDSSQTEGINPLPEPKSTAGNIAYIESLGEQASALKELADSFADLPSEVVTALLERGGEPGRLQRAVEALQAGRQSGRSVAPDSSQTEKTNPLPEPKLTADNIAYIEVARDNRRGRVVIRHDKYFYYVAVGESFDIRQKHYDVVAIRYLTPLKVELRLRTKYGISNLIKGI